MKKPEYTCSCCGQSRTFDELNGMTFENGQWSDHAAYCRQLFNCHSTERDDIENWVQSQLAQEEEVQ